ncbi:MAG: type II CAAX endopeptidase family protein [Planctomycetota bacterium]
MTDGARTWPVGRQVADEEAIGTACGACGTPWRVHRNLAGYRFQCGECGTWVSVPTPAAPTPLQIEATQALQPAEGEDASAAVDAARRPVHDLPLDAQGLVEIDLPEGAIYQGRIPGGAAMAPGALRHAREEERARWTNRTILEVGGMFVAIVLPFLLTMQLFGEDEAAVLMPLSSLFGGALVVLIGLAAPRYTFGALRRAPLRFFAEAATVAAVTFAAAMGWAALVDDVFGVSMDEEITELLDLLGPVLMIAVMAVAPAIFEELAFRGLLHGRLTALMGTFEGILATAAFFAMAHGIGFGTPFHLALGVYLGFLRERSGSLLPGMLMHYLYNGAIVLSMSA